MRKMYSLVVEHRFTWPPVAVVFDKVAQPAFESLLLAPHERQSTFASRRSDANSLPLSWLVDVFLNDYDFSCGHAVLLYSVQRKDDKKL